MTVFKKIAIFLGVVLFGGALFSIFLQFYVPQSDYLYLTGFGYALIFAVSFLIANRFVSQKLSVFPALQGWLIRSTVYILAGCFAFLCGLFFQSLFLYSGDQIASFLINGSMEAIYFFLTLPFGENPDPGFVANENRQMVALFFMVMFLLGAFGLLFAFVEMRWQALRQSQLALNAEIKFLQAQIEPHFLFNSLNTIVTLIKKNPEKAEDLLIRLSELLRFKFNFTRNSLVPLEQELQFSQNYAELMLARFGKRLQIEWQIQTEDHAFRIPAMLIQPLMENALKHAWKEDQSDLKLEIEITRTVHELHMAIKDNGCGIPDEISKKLQTGMTNAQISNHALANISGRLKLLYGRNHLLKIDSKSQQGTKITLIIPETL